MGQLTTCPKIVDQNFEKFWILGKVFPKMFFEILENTFWHTVKRTLTKQDVKRCLKLTPCSSVSDVNFEHVIAGWVN